MQIDAQTLQSPSAEPGVSELSAREARPMTDFATDRAAFEQLVKEHEDRIVGYLTRLTGQRERAEDVAQETFVRFYQHRHRYREEGTVTAYLFRIATNLVRSQERRKKRWRLLQPVLGRGGRSPDGVREEGESQVGDPQRRALASEEQRQVTRAIARLDLTYRAPLVMREIQGFSYREIAAALEISEGTVKSRLHRAREMLRQELTPYWKGAC